jgi:hypothetical protein
VPNHRKPVRLSPKTEQEFRKMFGEIVLEHMQQLKVIDQGLAERVGEAVRRALQEESERQRSPQSVSIKLAQAILIGLFSTYLWEAHVRESVITAPAPLAQSRISQLEGTSPLDRFGH